MSKTEEAKGPQLPASPVGILPRLMSDAASELFYINIKTSGSQIRKFLTTRGDSTYRCFSKVF